MLLVAESVVCDSLGVRASYEYDPHIPRGWVCVRCSLFPLPSGWSFPSLIYMDNKTCIRITNKTGLIWRVCTNKVLQIAGRFLKVVDCGECSVVYPKDRLLTLLNRSRWPVLFLSTKFINLSNRQGLPTLSYPRRLPSKVYQRPRYWRGRPTLGKRLHQLQSNRGSDRWRNKETGGRGSCWGQFLVGSTSGKIKCMTRAVPGGTFPQDSATC